MNNCHENEKETLISNLKNELYQLDGIEEEYYNLLINYKNLENEFQLINEEKLKLEY